MFKNLSAKYYEQNQKMVSRKGSLKLSKDL